MLQASSLGHSCVLPEISPQTNCKTAKFNKQSWSLHKFQNSKIIGCGLIQTKLKLENKKKRTNKTRESKSLAFQSAVSPVLSLSEDHAQSRNPGKQLGSTEKGVYQFGFVFSRNKEYDTQWERECPTSIAQWHLTWFEYEHCYRD